MTKKLILCAIAGAFAAQIWLMISWMVLPWHFSDFKSFTDDIAVAENFTSDHTEAGIYMLPNYDPAIYENEDQMADYNARISNGPYAFMVVRPDGINLSKGPMFLMGFILNGFIAGVLYWLLSLTRITSNKEKILFIMVAGTIGGIHPIFSHWNWWYFPTGYTLVSIADLAIQWAVVGFAMVMVNNKLKA